MYKIVFVLIFFSLSLFAFTSKEIAKHIDLCDKLRVRTQKMTKEALLIKLDIQKNKNIKELKNTSYLFDKTLNTLIEGDKDIKPINNEAIHKSLKEIKQEWQPFYKNIKNIYMQKELDSSYDYIIKNSSKFRKKIMKVVNQYTQLAQDKINLKLANNLNYAGKNRTRSQKVVKNFLMYKANINKKQALEELKKSVTLFDKTLDGLINGSKELKLVKTTLPQAKDRLLKVKKSWQELKKDLNKALKSSNKEDIINIVSKAKDVRLNLKELILIYTNSLNRQKQALKLNSIVDNFLSQTNANKALINRVGKQRLLTQKIAKLAIDCNLNLVKNRCLKLQKGVSSFNKTLLALKVGNKNMQIEPLQSAEAKEELLKIKKLWIPYAKSAIKVQNSGGKDLKSIEYILNHNKELLEESDKLVKILIKENSKNLDYIEKEQLHIINIAGKERMLIPKMVKEYLAQFVYNLSSYNNLYRKTMSEFETSLNGLINGDSKLYLPKVTNPKIKTQLVKVQKLWFKIKPIFARESKKKKDLKLLLSVNPILLKEMNKAVELIESETEY